MKCLNCKGSGLGYMEADDGGDTLVCFDCGFVEELD